MADEDRLDKGNVLAKVILEILGAPKEHVENSLKSYIHSLRKNKEFEIVREEFEEPEQQKELFSAFAELDIWFRSPSALLDFCFDSMPSSVEIIKPASISIKSEELTGLLNDLQARLHHTEMAVKTYKARQEVMDHNALGLVRNFVLHIVRESPKSPSEIASELGIPEKNLKAFIDTFIKEKVIFEKEGKYARSAGRGA